jgi:hypothetical protein
MSDTRPGDPLLARSFFDLLQATNEPDQVKRHEALKRWWDKNIVTVSCQTTLDYLMLAATRDPLDMIAHVWASNAAKMARKVIEEHGIVQQIPPEGEFPDRTLSWNELLSRGHENRDLTWLTRMYFLRP